MTAEQIHERLKLTYQDADVEVIDLTGTHDHFQVIITSSAFNGVTRIQQHKMIMNVFQPELHTGEIHAFSIKANAKN